MFFVCLVLFYQQRHHILKTYPQYNQWYSGIAKTTTYSFAREWALAGYSLGKFTQDLHIVSPRLSLLATTPESRAEECVFFLHRRKWSWIAEHTLCIQKYTQKVLVHKAGPVPLPSLSQNKNKNKKRFLLYQNLCFPISWSSSVWALPHPNPLLVTFQTPRCSPLVLTQGA